MSKHGNCLAIVVFGNSMKKDTDFQKVSRMVGMLGIRNSLLLKIDQNANLVDEFYRRG